MTITQQARTNVPGFEQFYQKLCRQMSIHDRANSTMVSYARNLARMALYFNCVPTEVSRDEVDDYLYKERQTFSEGLSQGFKFTIFSLRFACRMEGKVEFAMRLPAITRQRKLPVVLSKSEVAAMLNKPPMLKHRVLIALLYGCGLRCSEVRKLKVSDIDLDRSVLLVRRSKGRKDRYVPMGKTLTAIVKSYIDIQKPSDWLFPGQRWGHIRELFFSKFENQYGKRTIQWAIKRAAILAGISKPVNVHCLRHTYATHLLEDGINIFTIQKLLGHANFKTTLIYLHVAQVTHKLDCSPMDTLEAVRVIQGKQTELAFQFED